MRKSLGVRHLRASVRLRDRLGWRRPQVGGKHSLAAALRLAQAPDDDGEGEGRQREDDERSAPREEGDVAGDREAHAGAEVLARENDAVDPAALPASEPVADERGDHRPGRGRDGAEEEARPKQLPEARGRRAPQHRAAPEDDRRAEHPSSSHAVGQDAERQRRHRADEGADRDEQADVRVRDVQAGTQFARRGAHRCRVGAAQAEDRGQDDDHACALLAPERDRQAAREGARRGRAERGRVGEDARGTRFVGAHVLMVAGASACSRSNVAADKQHRSDRERGGAVPSEEEAADEPGQRVRGVVNGEELPTGLCSAG